MTKPWNRKEKLDGYRVNSRTKNATFLIVCEGQTEEQYFKAFPVVSATVQSVHSGMSKTALVNSVREHIRGRAYDQVWCIFDLDIDAQVAGQNEDFNRAIGLAQHLGYRCAYSNDSFELWFALHYQYLDQEQHRQYYFRFLSERWGIDYTREGKKLSFARSIYLRLRQDGANQALATRHAEKLWIEKKDQAFHRQNPTTTVFQLVKELNKYCRK